MESYLAYNVNEEIRKKSSSGGIFYSLSKYILDNKGIVFGASWNNDWLVDMSYVDNLEDLPKLMGSKYIPANIKNTFKECKDFLDNGKLVLYAGLPCQLHGLKKYLNKEYNNLYLVDIACHGTMPLQVWKDYLETIKRPNANIISINFRLKEPDWANYSFEVQYSDGKALRENHRNNKYMKVFLSDKYLKASCYNCKFKNNFSCADINIGDAWGANINWEKKNGISFIKCYTSKGRELLNKLTNLKLKEYNYSNMPNGCLNNKLTTSPIKYNSSIFKKKIGIITLNLHTNIGGVLQAFALQKYVNSLGYDSEVISTKTSWLKTPMKFTKEYIKVRYIDSFSEIGRNDYDMFIVGSDQVWRQEYANKYILDNFLKFCYKWDINKISYAASFGKKIPDIDQKNLKAINYLIKQFSAISVRELDGIDIIKNYFKLDAEQVMDPTLLLNKYNYEDICKTVKKKPNNAFIYILDNSSKTENYLKGKGIDFIKALPDNVYDWLACFRDCKYIITDSFHGCMFSIIFNKPFICIENKSRGSSRFDTLKKLFNINSNFIDTIEKIDCNNLDYNCQYNVEKVLEFSKNWLEINLKNNPKTNLPNIPEERPKNNIKLPGSKSKKLGNALGLSEEWWKDNNF